MEPFLMTWLFLNIILIIFKILLSKYTYAYYNFYISTDFFFDTKKESSFLILYAYLLILHIKHRSEFSIVFIYYFLIFCINIILKKGTCNSVRASIL